MKPTPAPRREPRPWPWGKGRSRGRDVAPHVACDVGCPGLARGAPQVVYEGRFLRLRIKDGWEYVERPNCTGAVIIVAVTDQERLVLTEQFRKPVGKPVIEFPAGLIGDKGSGKETYAQAARRELLEEAGYDAKRIVPLVSGPTSSGLTAEVVFLVRALGLRKRGGGGGDGSESITVHEVPLADVAQWLRRQARRGKLVDPKVYVGLYFLTAKGQVR